VIQPVHAAGLEEVDPVGEEGDEAGDVETGPDVVEATAKNGTPVPSSDVL